MSAPADLRAAFRAAPQLTHVELTWREGRVEHWLRFGCPATEQRLDRARRIAHADVEADIDALLAEVERARAPEVRALAAKLRADARLAATACVFQAVRELDPRCCVWCAMACSLSQAADLLDAVEA